LPQGQLRVRTLALAAAVALVAGCGGRQPSPRVPDGVRGYLDPPPPLTGVDAAPLRGRRVLIDPGHGGRFRGAIGAGGLSEAEVNLGVALYLQGMLQWAGADVHLTRTADVDLTTAADSSLAGDLAARVAICDSLAPDVFVSIHHNSNAARDPVLNETQTYYPLGREGADLDLARAIHRRLVRALAIEPAQILPGGFHVLRHAPAPAVLGEPAMLSNPVIERRLTLARSLELEAAAYFLGLRDYYAGGTPRWLSDQPDTIEVGPGRAPQSWTFDPGRPDAPALDPTTVSLTVDGEPVPFTVDADGRRVRARLAVAARTATVALAGRNLAGRATPVLQQVVRSERHVSLRCRTLLETGADGEILDRVLLVYESPGVDLAEFVDLTLELGPGGGVALPRHRGERGWCFVDRRALRAAAATARITGRLANGAPVSAPVAPDLAATTAGDTLAAGSTLVALRCPESTWPLTDIPGDRWRSRLPPPDGPEWSGEPGRPWSRPLLDDRTPLAVRQRDRGVWLEADGALPLVLDAAGRTAWQDPAGSPPDTVTWDALLPDLVGRRVAIDPRGGGTDAAGRGPEGTRGSDLNLAVARRLAALLRGAGCSVTLLRDEDEWTPDPDRVRRADGFGADLYLALGRGGPAVRHHPGSRLGAPWAASCAAALGRLLGAPIAAAAGSDFVLRHTACPAVVVELESPATAAVEDRLAAPAWQDAEARAIFWGTVSLLQAGVEAVPPADLVAALAPRALASERLDLVRVDGNFQWLPPPGQSWDTLVPSPGGGDCGVPLLGDRHVLELRAGPLWQLWAITRQPSGSWQGRLLLENR